jgi:hypothetical protein
MLGIAHACMALLSLLAGFLALLKKSAFPIAQWLLIDFS